MIVNARLSLLVLTVASFMGIWSQDSQPTVEMVIAQYEATQSERHMVVREPMTHDACDNLESSESAAPQFVGTPLSIPHFVAPGTYRAVNHQGQTHIVRVPSTSANSDQPVRGFYVHEPAGQRWYLIRQETLQIAGQDGSSIR